MEIITEKYLEKTNTNIDAYCGESKSATRFGTNNWLVFDSYQEYHAFLEKYLVNV